MEHCLNQNMNEYSIVYNNTMQSCINAVEADPTSQVIRQLGVSQSEVDRVLRNNNHI